MTHEQVYPEIKETMGIVPDFFKGMSHDTIRSEWELMKFLEFQDEPIPGKQRELIGLGLMSTQKCHYCTFLRSEFAKVYDATDEELEFAAHVAKSMSGWTGFFYGLQIDVDSIRKEVEQVTKQMSTGLKPVEAGPLKDMSRDEIFKDMKGILGFVPIPFQKMSQDTLNLEWHLLKQLWFAHGPIHQKYRHLMGIAIASTQKAMHSVIVHTGLAKGFGATDEEIEHIVHFAKSDSGWSTYLYGIQYDLDKFKKEVKQMCDHARSTMMAEVAG